MSKNKPTGPQKGSARNKVNWKTLEIVHPDAAGIDVGGSEHWVAVSPDRDPEPVRRFGCFTADLREMGNGWCRCVCGAWPCNLLAYIGCPCLRFSNSMVWKCIW